MRRTDLITAEHGTDTFDPDGWTPLHLAAFQAALEDVQILLDARAQSQRDGEHAAARGVGRCAG